MINFEQTILLESHTFSRLPAFILKTIKVNKYLYIPKVSGETFEHDLRLNLFRNSEIFCLEKLS